MAIPTVGQIYFAAGGAIIIIDSSFFTGNIYQNNRLKNKISDINFEVYSNEGSGALLSVNGGYTYDSTTGTLTMSPGKYKIKIY